MVTFAANDAVRYFSIHQLLLTVEITHSRVSRMFSQFFTLICALVTT